MDSISVGYLSTASRMHLLGKLSPIVPSPEGGRGKHQLLPPTTRRRRRGWILITSLSALTITLLLLALPCLAAETVSYGYDAMQRLVRAQYSSGAVIEYGYDNMGNRRVRNVYTAGAPANSPPGQATSPAPADGATGVAGPLTMSWTASDPDPGDSLTYFVYAGTDVNALQLLWSGAANSFTPWSLQANTAYFWKVVARDSHNTTTSGPVWSFSTGSAVVNGLPVSLSVILAGTGGGTVMSSPQGIVCTGATTDVCSSVFPYGSAVSLTAVIDGVSKFAGWSVASCGINPSCIFTINDDTIVSSLFNGVPAIWIILTLPTFPGFPPFELPPFDAGSFLEASTIMPYMPYPMVLKSHNRVYTEDFIFNAGVNPVTWKGGHSGDFATVTGTTVLQGVLKIQSGKLIVTKVAIK